MRLASLAALCALGLSANASATTLDSLDVYFLHGDVEASDPAGGSASYDADGFGAKFRGSVGDDFFFSGEYQQLRTDAGAVGDQTEWRLGLGTPLARTGGLTIYGLLEYVHMQVDRTDFDDDGAAAQVGVLFSPSERLSLYGQAGYLKLREADGPEYLLGAAFQIKRWGGLFAEYRDTSLERDSGGDAGFSGFRTGVYLVVPR